MINIYRFLVFVFLVVFFSGCVSVDVPDYDSLENNLKKVDLVKSEIKSGEYTFVENSIINISLDEAGYHDKIIKTMDGDLSVKRYNDKVDITVLAKLPFFISDLVKVEVTSNKCGKDRGIPYIEIINKDGTVNTNLTSKVRQNKKIKKMLNNFTQSNLIFACTNWKVDEIKDKANSSVFNRTIAGDKLSFKTLALPIRYKGITSYLGKNYYYFVVKNGKARIDSQMYNDDIAKFQINGKFLVNVDNLVTEYLSLIYKGNFWNQGYNFDVEFKHNFSLKDKTIK